jgi:hypothetical protein
MLATEGLVVNHAPPPEPVYVFGTFIPLPHILILFKTPLTGGVQINPTVICPLPPGIALTL